MIRQSIINRARQQRGLAQALIARHRPIVAAPERRGVSAWPAIAAPEHGLDVDAGAPELPGMDAWQPAPEFFAEPAGPAWPPVFAPADGNPQAYEPAPPAPAAAPTASRVSPDQTAPAAQAARLALSISAGEPAYATHATAAAPGAAAPITAAAPPFEAPPAARLDGEPFAAPPLAPADPPAYEPVPESEPAHESPLAPLAGDPLADLVRRMRQASWRAPEEPAPAAVPTAGGPLADLIHQMRQPVERPIASAARRRVPMGQRMAEASDFDQPPPPAALGATADILASQPHQDAATKQVTPAEHADDVPLGPARTSEADAGGELQPADQQGRNSPAPTGSQPLPGEPKLQPDAGSPGDRQLPNRAPTAAPAQHPTTGADATSVAEPQAKSAPEHSEQTARLVPNSPALPAGPNQPAPTVAAPPAEAASRSIAAAPTEATRAAEARAWPDVAPDLPAISVTPSQSATTTNPSPATETPAETGLAQGKRPDSEPAAHPRPDARLAHDARQPQPMSPIRPLERSARPDAAAPEPAPADQTTPAGDVPTQAALVEPTRPAETLLTTAQNDQQLAQLVASQPVADGAAWADAESAAAKAALAVAPELDAPRQGNPATQPAAPASAEPAPATAHDTPTAQPNRQPDQPRLLNQATDLAQADRSAPAAPASSAPASARPAIASAEHTRQAVPAVPATAEQPPSQLAQAPILERAEAPASAPAFAPADWPATPSRLPPPSILAPRDIQEHATGQGETEHASAHQSASPIGLPAAPDPALATALAEAAPQLRQYLNAPPHIGVSAGNATQPSLASDPSTHSDEQATPGQAAPHDHPETPQPQDHGARPASAEIAQSTHSDSVGVQPHHLTRARVDQSTAPDESPIQPAAGAPAPAAAAADTATSYQVERGPALADAQAHSPSTTRDAAPQDRPRSDVDRAQTSTAHDRRLPSAGPASSAQPVLAGELRPPAPGTPQAWAARVAQARRAQVAELPPQPIATPAAAEPAPQPGDPNPGTPQAWATRVASHAQATQAPASAQPWVERLLREAAPSLPATPPEPSSSGQATAPSADQTPATGTQPAPKQPAQAPGTPQAWAARVASHAQAIQAPAPAQPWVERLLREAVPSQPSAQPEPRPASQSSAVSASQPAATPGMPQAWAARLTRESHASQAPAPTPTTQQLGAPVSAEPASDTAGSAAGTPQAWAARVASHAQALQAPTPAQPWVERLLREAAPNQLSVQPERISGEQATPPGAERSAAASLQPAPSQSGAPPGTPQAWAARVARDAQAGQAAIQAEAERLPRAATGTPLPGQQAASMPAEDTPERLASAARAEAQPAPDRQLNNRPAARPIVPARAAVPPASQPGPAAVLRAAQPTPLAETTRRFLRPLVGVDPAEVRVYRGAQAGALASAYRADGLASGDIVALASAHSADTPATLGLLAHELTHVARQRDPSFRPPLARQAAASALPDEEALATAVEAQVQSIARRRADSVPATPQLGEPASPPTSQSNPNPARPAAAPPQPAGWGGLPAPWEPLPDWLAPAEPAARPGSPPATAAPPAARPAATPVQAPPPVAAPASARPQAEAGQASAPVQLAQTGRTLAEPPADAEPAPEPTPAPEPDLDALARQVYGMLKQRLAAERRRSQS